MNTKKLKKLLILNVPYFLVGAFATNLGEAWRIADGSNMSEKVQGLVTGGGFSQAFSNILPSIHRSSLPGEKKSFFRSIFAGSRARFPPRQ